MKLWCCMKVYEDALIIWLKVLRAYCQCGAMFLDAPWHSPFDCDVYPMWSSPTKIRMKMAMANRTSRFYDAYGSMRVRPSVSQPKLLKVSMGDKMPFYFKKSHVFHDVPCDIASMTIFHLNIFHAVEAVRHRKPEKKSGWPRIEIPSAEGEKPWKCFLRFGLGIWIHLQGT